MSSVPPAVGSVDPADTALLVARALRHLSVVLTALAVGAAAGCGAAVEAAALERGAAVAAAEVVGLQGAGVALLVGLVVVVAVHVALRSRARRALADRIDRAWAAVEPRWSDRGAL